jgi:hypothetical protein
MSSDSDDEIGRRLDESSSDEKPKKKYKKEKKKEKKKEPKPVALNPPPANSPPQRHRLTAGRRNQVIQLFQIGKEDPEYQVQKLSNGSFRVTKRKSFYTPTTSVETVSPKNSDIPLTWMNMQNEVNEGLSKQLKKLKINYAKLSEKYEERNTKPPPPNEDPLPTPLPTQVPLPPAPVPQPAQPVPQPAQPLRKPARRGRSYAAMIQSIRDY